MLLIFKNTKRVINLDNFDEVRIIKPGDTGNTYNKLYRVSVIRYLDMYLDGDVANKHSYLINKDFITTVKLKDFEFEGEAIAFYANILDSWSNGNKIFYIN